MCPGRIGHPLKLFSLYFRKHFLRLFPRVVTLVTPLVTQKCSGNIAKMQVTKVTQKKGLRRIYKVNLEKISLLKNTKIFIIVFNEIPNIFIK